MPIQTAIDGGRTKYVSVSGGRTMYLVQNGQTIYHETVDFSRSAVANGSIGAGSTADGPVPMGTSVTVIATPSSGYVFDKWERGSGSSWATVSTSATYTFTMDTSWREPNHQVRAVFVYYPTTFTVQVTGLMGYTNYDTGTSFLRTGGIITSVDSGTITSSTTSSSVITYTVVRNSASCTLHTDIERDYMLYNTQSSINGQAPPKYRFMHWAQAAPTNIGVWTYNKDINYTVPYNVTNLSIYSMHECTY